MSDQSTTETAEHSVESQARQQTGQKQIQLSIDEKSLKTAYANAFRNNATAEEVVLDFGLNLTGPSQNAQFAARSVFEVENRVILNYYTAKRLALVLSQIVQRHEQQFGEIKLNAGDRVQR